MIQCLIWEAALRLRFWQCFRMMIFHCHWIQQDPSARNGEKHQRNLKLTFTLSPAAWERNPKQLPALLPQLNTDIEPGGQLYQNVALFFVFFPLNQKLFRKAVPMESKIDPHIKDRATCNSSTSVTIWHIYCWRGKGIIHASNSVTETCIVFFQADVSRRVMSC